MSTTSTDDLTPDPTCHLLRDLSELEAENSKLKFAATEAQRKQAFFNALIANSRDGIALTSVDRRVLRIFRSLGGHSTETQGALVEDLIHPDDRSIVFESYRKLNEEHAGAVEFEVRLCTGGNEIRWIAGRLTDMIEDPNVQAMVLNYSDITEIKAAEIAKTELELLSATSPRRALFSCTPQGCICTWNTGAEAFFGYRREEVVGTLASRLIPPDLHVEDERIREDLTRGIAVPDLATERLRQDGTRLPVAVRFRTVLDFYQRVRAITNLVTLRETA